MKTTSRLIKEVIPVIIGVLIALIINNWNEDRKDANYLKQILSSVTEELEESKKDIIESLPRQQVLLDSIDVYMDDESVSLMDIVKISNGIKFSTMKNNSWKAIASSKIELIDYEQLSALSDLDEGKEELQFKNEKAIDFLYANAKETNAEAKEFFQLIIQDIIWTEERLQKQIEALHKKWSLLL